MAHWVLSGVLRSGAFGKEMILKCICFLLGCPQTCVFSQHEKSWLWKNLILYFLPLEITLWEIRRTTARPGCRLKKEGASRTQVLLLRGCLPSKLLWEGWQWLNKHWNNWGLGRKAATRLGIGRTSFGFLLVVGGAVLARRERKSSH